jgi:hypothetical protein
MMQTIRALPRTTITTSLRVLRLPLSMAERVAGQRDNESWPPALAFEKLEGRLETLAGSLLRDEELAETGEQRSAKVVKLEEARALETAADYEKATAREEERKRATEIARQKARSNRAARERKDTAKAKAAKEKQAAETVAAKREAAAEGKAEAQEKVVDRNERAAKAAALRAESEALDLTDEALQAKETVDLIDETIDANKEARRTG